MDYESFFQWYRPIICVIHILIDILRDGIIDILGDGIIHILIGIIDILIGVLNDIRIDIFGVMYIFDE